MASALQPRRDRGVHCIRFVGPKLHHGDSRFGGWNLHSHIVRKPRAIPAIVPVINRAYSTRPVLRELAHNAAQAKPITEVAATNPTLNERRCPHCGRSARKPQAIEASGRVSRRHCMTPSRPPTMDTTSDTTNPPGSALGVRISPSTQSQSVQAAQGNTNIQRTKCAIVRGNITGRELIWPNI
jgi:hypothetical protein